MHQQADAWWGGSPHDSRFNIAEWKWFLVNRARRWKRGHDKRPSLRERYRNSKMSVAPSDICAPGTDGFAEKGPSDQPCKLSSRIRCTCEKTKELLENCCWQLANYCKLLTERQERWLIGMLQALSELKMDCESKEILRTRFSQDFTPLAAEKHMLGWTPKSKLPPSNHLNHLWMPCVIGDSKSWYPLMGFQ